MSEGTIMSLKFSDWTFIFLTKNLRRWCLDERLTDLVDDGDAASPDDQMSLQRHDRDCLHESSRSVLQVVELFYLKWCVADESDVWLCDYLVQEALYVVINFVWSKSWSPFDFKKELKIY